MKGNKISSAAWLCAAALFTGCAVAGPVADELNPYGQGNQVDSLGTRDNSAVLGASGGGSQEGTRARHALEVLGTYRRAQAPQPVYPVIQPAEVRLMWIPDHQNIHGDLVPAHYYYLRVLNDRWAVQDAFEIESQLHGPGINYGGAAAATGPGGGNTPSTTYGTSGAGATPWVYKEE